MPTFDVTNSILTEEKQELEQILKNNPKAREEYEQFEAEYKIRSELVKARKQSNVTQMELKERSGLTQQAISRIETDNEVSPSLKTLIKYVNAIGHEIILKPKEEEKV